MRTIVLLTLGLGLTLSSGCSMCAPGFLDDYATVGGKWQRSDPTQGRVGSIFSDPGSSIASGADGQDVVDSYPAGVEGEYFGEAYTDSYSGSQNEYTEEFTEDYGDGYTESYGGEHYDLHDNMEQSEFAPEMYDGSGDALQFDNKVLTLGEQW